MKNEPTDLSLSEDNTGTQSLALSQTNPIGRMIEAVTKSGVSSDNMAVLERMMDLYERVEAKNAEKAFAEAFVALQSELPTIVAKSAIPNRGKYERFEDLMEAVGPLLFKHGFTVYFTQEPKENRIFSTCRLRHKGGHYQDTSFGVRLGGKADSDTQADTKASTTARRLALVNALNLVVRQDALQSEEDYDARLDGSIITPDKVIYLREVLAESNSDPLKFIGAFGFKSFEEITSGSYGGILSAAKVKADRMKGAQ